jgi:acetyltransferase-like isoleucine patch superfamily enzyme
MNVCLRAEGCAMKDLIILGTGVHAQEMAEIVERVNGVEPSWRLLGYIAGPDGARHVGKVFNGHSVLGCADCMAEYPDAWFIPDNEFPASTEAPRGRLATLIDPSCFISQTASIGAGCVLYPNCFVGLHAVLRDRVFTLSGSVINHDDTLEDRVVLCSGVLLAGSVHIESDCYLGQGCMIRQSLRVGRDSLIGMGSVVVTDVGPHSVMAGNPARKLRDRRDRR